jgi:hypothetical protein
VAVLERLGDRDHNILKWEVDPSSLTSYLSHVRYDYINVGFGSIRREWQKID